MGTIRTRTFVLISFGVFVGCFVVWLVLTETGAVDPLFLPAPDEIFNRLVDQASSGTLWLDIRDSTFRIAVGFAIATALAVPLGVLMGAYRVWEAALEPLVDFVRYMPVVAFVPLTILWVGTGDLQKFTIVFIGTFFQQVLLIMDNVRRVPTDLVNIGLTLGLRDPSILRRVIVPSAGPGIWDSMRISLGWAWTWLVLAELVAATTGLGYRITVGQRFFQTDLILGYILVLGLLGLVADQLMRFVGRRWFAWAEEAR